MLRSGFTLIELLIVVAIIGILAAIAVPNFLNAQIKARIARVEADHSAVVTALEMYRSDHSSYPDASHSDNADQGFVMLTTPTAYINNVLYDPFARKYETSRGNDYDLTYEFDTARWQGGSAYNMYIVESLGPDEFDSFNSTTYPGHNVEMQFFDITNGLRSSGDILRAGGAYIPRWFRERKGGPATANPRWI